MIAFNTTLIAAVGQHCPNLLRLELGSKTRLDGATLAPLANLARLEELVLPSTVVPGAPDDLYEAEEDGPVQDALGAVAALHSLRRIRLGGREVAPGGHRGRA